MAKIKKLNQEKLITIIGQGTHITGDIHFTGGLHIDGQITGNILDDSEEHAVLTMSETGQVTGNIRVRSVVINGMVDGNIHSKEFMEVAADAKITGNIDYESIMMAMGAQVNGRVKCTEDTSSTD